LWPDCDEHHHHRKADHQLVEEHLAMPPGDKPTEAGQQADHAD
jgi:hypothetical protein